jgi:hypothetical protein
MVSYRKSELQSGYQQRVFQDLPPAVFGARENSGIFRDGGPTIAAPDQI